MNIDPRTCTHTYWPQIREDGRANINKCGRCGHIRPWTLVDEAQAIAEGTGLNQQPFGARWLPKEKEAR
jgi:hypothetical protein